MKKKGFIIIGIRDDGAITASVENSFSMGFSSNRVKIYQLDRYNYEEAPHKLIQWLQKTTDELTKEHLRFTFKVYRVGSKKCPVKIDWTDRINSKRKLGCDKFKYRNLPFTVKHPVGINE